MEKHVEVICAHCGNKVQKLRGTYNQSLKLGRRFFCNSLCASYGNAAFRANAGSAESTERIKKYPRNDAFQNGLSPFRHYLMRIKSFLNSPRGKRFLGHTDITLEYLKELWEKQKGVCPYTGHVMEIPRNAFTAHKRGSPKRASLDRIDPSKGYVIGNVEFICMSANFAKNDFSREQMLDFFKRIAIVSSS